MAKIKMTIENGITFEEGCEEYILDCKSRNLREGTIRHYRDTMVQMKKYIGSDTLFKSLLGKPCLLWDGMGKTHIRVLVLI